ncbi:hypothetical protein VTN77DRAFT_5570 [Rasamsonia byssochlamydoides]|uniref:uncharacterized protein n=1 Tax=Rasamsonia byssochlamydoides TaxID=89139 RepID=UPI003744B0F2
MFLRSVSRAAARSSAAITSPAVRSSTSPMACLNARSQFQSKILASQQTRSESQHAIANPILAGIEKRWETMPPQEQAELWMQLRDRMKADWHDLTLQEKKAAYWIAFGPHGPRAEPPKGEGWRILFKVSQLFAASLVIFAAIRMFARDPPRTMTKEWQEATNEYAKREKIEPITGISSEGYSGRGFVQSPPAKKSA